MILFDAKSLLIVAIVFLPIERLFALKPQQILRNGWQIDLSHFLITGVIIRFGLVGVVTIVTLLAGWLAPSTLRDAVSEQPIWLQFVEALLIGDLGFYLAHRAFHAIPFLWRFHSVHHSIEELDWPAGHRVHPVDQILTKGASFTLIVAMGFSPTAIALFGIVYHWQSLLLHANTRFNFGPLACVFADPRFHRWHHARDAAATDKNFGGQLSLYDLVFGTLYLPRGMPERFGTDTPVPHSYLGQLAFPFARRQTPAGFSSPK